MKITLKIKQPTTLVLDLPNDTDFAVEGREVHSTQTGPEFSKQVYDAAKTMADARTDFEALRDIRDGFATSSDRLALATLFAGKHVNGDEFIGLLAGHGQTQPVAQAIFGGINMSLGARGQA